MNGSPKQIEWALKLRENAQEIFNGIDVPDEFYSEEGIEQYNETVKYWNLIKDIPESKFWIEMKTGISWDFSPKWMYEKALRKGLIHV